MPDPTLDLVRSLAEADPSKWVVVRGVPVFRPHRRDDEGGTAKVTTYDLPTIAEATNRVFKDSGTPARISIGHINPEPRFPERDQPEIVAFAKDFRAGVFGPSRLPAVLADFYVKAGRAAEPLTALFEKRLMTSQLVDYLTSPDSEPSRSRFASLMPESLK